VQSKLEEVAIEKQFANEYEEARLKAIENIRRKEEQKLQEEKETAESLRKQMKVNACFCNKLSLLPEKSFQPGKVLEKFFGLLVWKNEVILQAWSFDMHSDNILFWCFW